MPLYDSAPFNLVRATGEFATIASVIQVLYFSTKMADLSTRFTGVKDVCILCCENLFIAENMEWVSFIIIAQSFQDLISKVHNPRDLHECWKWSCTLMRDEAKIALTLMKFKGLHNHFIRGYSYYYWSLCIVKMSKFILIPHLYGYILLYGRIPHRSIILKYIRIFHVREYPKFVKSILMRFICASLLL